MSARRARGPSRATRGSLCAQASPGLVGAFVWAVLVCMVGAFLIAEAYISTFNLPVLGISAVAAIGVILIITALLSGRSKKRKDTAAQASSPADAIRTD